MRKIKFRAWHGSGSMQFLGVINWNDNVVEPLGGGEEVSIDEIVLMQFTGLHDKNGKEIYEGDIVVKNSYIWFDKNKPNYRGTVEWIYSQWQVVAHCINKNKRGISDGINEGLNDDGFEDNEKSDWEVIGNIYENPELLPKEQQ